MAKRTVKNYWHSILSFLRIRTVQGGFEISDQILRFVSDGDNVKTAAVRLEPGILEAGKIKDEAAFRAALKMLRSSIGHKHDSAKVNVVVTLSSVGVYSQTFSLPIIEGKALDRAIELNLQMLFPMDPSQGYQSSEFLRRDEQAFRLEYLAAFVDKKTIDDLTTALFAEGFIAIAAEPRSLSLLRLVRKGASGIDPAKSYLIITIDNSGLDFVVDRNGSLYFEYENRWADLMDEKGEITAEKFKDSFGSNLRQVLHFYEQHWTEPLGGVILSATGFQDEAAEVIAATTPAPILPLVIELDRSLAPEWMVSLGASLRPAKASGKEQVNLIGTAAAGVFFEEQMVRFMNFWRVVIPAALGLLLITFGVALNFVVHTEGYADMVAPSQTGGAELAQIASLEASATAFNQSVSLLAGIEASLQPKYKILNDLENFAAANNVTISQISLQGPTAPVFLSGGANDETSIVNFKNAIQADSRFGTVDLPLENIQSAGTGFTFSMNFPLSSAAYQ